MATTAAQTDGRQAREGAPVQSLVRAFAVLKSFDASAPAMTITDVAARSGLDRAAARRYLLTLQDMGYVGLDGRRFFLRPRILELGYRYLSSLGIPQLAQPHLIRLAGDLGESCAVTVLDGDEITYVAVANAERTLAIQLSVGNRLPAYCTAMGRVLLAGLPADQLRARLPAQMPPQHTTHTLRTIDDLVECIATTRRSGWAVVDQELEDGVRSVAAPLHDVHGRTVAALSVSVPAARVTIDTLESGIRTRMQETATTIHGQLSDSLVPEPLAGLGRPHG